MLGDEIVYASGNCFASITDYLGNKVFEEEIQKDVEKILGYLAECDYYAFVKWW